MLSLLGNATPRLTDHSWGNNKMIQRDDVIFRKTRKSVYMKLFRFITTLCLMWQPEHLKLHMWFTYYILHFCHWSKRHILTSLSLSFHFYKKEKITIVPSHWFVVKRNELMYGNHFVNYYILYKYKWLSKRIPYEKTYIINQSGKYNSRLLWHRILMC